MGIDLVIFDCDGVLVDSEMLSAGVLMGMMTDEGFPLSEEAFRSDFLGRSFAAAALRAKALAAPRSRAGRYFSSPAAMPSRARAFEARSASRAAALAALGSFGVFKNCLRARWASLRDGVARPLVPEWVSSAAGVEAGVSLLLPRPNMGEA